MFCLTERLGRTVMRAVVVVCVYIAVLCLSVCHAAPSTATNRGIDIALIAVPRTHLQSNCSHNCSGNGDCLRGACHCNRGYGVSLFGQQQDCSVFTQNLCSVGCNGRGNCIPSASNDMTCSCKPGLHGRSCNHWSRCETFNFCSGHGSCSDEKEECECRRDYEGSDCSQTVTSCKMGCSGHGTCDIDGLEFSCECDHGFGGDGCGQVTGPFCPSHCSGLGSCQNGSCVCESTATGPACATIVNQCEHCVHGYCFEGQCKCLKGFKGDNCEQYVAALDEDCAALHWCSGYGVCHYGPLTDGGPYSHHCTCFDGFGGETCNRLDVSSACPHYCSGNGKCVLVPSPHCECSVGWTGSDCSASRCTSVNGTVCGGHGVCELAADGSNACTCDDGFSHGPHNSCEVAVVECMGGCSGHGTCVNEMCICASGYSGTHCSSSIASDQSHNQTSTPEDQTPHAPSNSETPEVTCGPACVHGDCEAGVCACEEAYTGADCSELLPPDNSPDGFEDAS